MSLSIAVVITAYNAETFIREALDSVRVQARKPEQIIVVDDGSTDHTPELVVDWGKRAGVDLRLVRQDNQGPGAARNAGIRLAQTDLVALLDADDMFLPHHLGQLEDAFQRQSTIVLCFGDVEVFGPSGILRPSYISGTLIETVQFEEAPDGLRLMKDSAYASLLWGSYILASGTIFSKKAAEGINLFDETLMGPEDRDFFLRLSRTGGFAYYPLLVARKREHAHNLTHPGRILSYQRYQLQVLQKMMKEADALGLSVWEVKRTRAAIADQVRDMLYVASRHGLRPYFKTATHLVSKGVVSPLCRPKDLLRAIACSLQILERN